jgi:hypothetical protein
MKLANPLYYPLAVFLGAIVLVLGVRMANLPRGVMVAIAAVIATTGATLLKSREPETLGLENPALEQELQAVRQQARTLATSASTVQAEAARLLTTSAQVELLGVVQYACDRANELPAKVDQLVQRMQGSDSLLSVTELQQQLREVEAKVSTSSGIAKDQLVRLADSLQRNIKLAQQGQDARQAQIASLSTVILDAAGMLQSLQNKLRTADLTDANQAIELRSLSNEFKTAQEMVDLLVSKS